MNNKYLSAILRAENAPKSEYMVGKAWKMEVAKGTAVIEEGSLIADR